MTTTGPEATVTEPIPAPFQGGQVLRVIDVEGVTTDVDAVGVDTPTEGHH